MRYLLYTIILFATFYYGTLLASNINKQEQTVVFACTVPGQTLEVIADKEPFTVGNKHYLMVFGVCTDPEEAQ